MADTCEHFIVCDCQLSAAETYEIMAEQEIATEEGQAIQTEDGKILIIE